MIGITIWLLVVASDGSYNRGNLTVVERFTTMQECERVKALLPGQFGGYSNYIPRCIQATVVKP